jgi:hypothetical protein
MSRNASNSREKESRSTGNSRDARNVGNTETLTAEGTSTAVGMQQDFFGPQMAFA